MATITTSSFANFYSIAWKRRLLDMPKDFYVMERFGRSESVPRNQTDTFRFYSYAPLSPATTALTEGTPPTPQDMTRSYVDATLEQYGGVIEITDWAAATSDEKLLARASELLSIQALDTRETLLREVLMSGSNVVYAGGAADRNSLAANTGIQEDDLYTIRATLMQNKIRPITRIVNPSNKYSTEPISAAYVVLVDPTAVSAVESLSGFIPVRKYADRSVIDPSMELGAWGKFRFLESNFVKTLGTNGTGQTVHGAIVLGQDSYAYLMLEGEGLKTYVKPFGSAGTSDPINQKASIGWKMSFAAAITRSEGVVRYEFTLG